MNQEKKPVKIWDWALYGAIDECYDTPMPKVCIGSTKDEAHRAKFTGDFRFCRKI